MDQKNVSWKGRSENFHGCENFTWKHTTVKRPRSDPQHITLALQWFGFCIALCMLSCSRHQMHDQILSFWFRCLMGSWVSLGTYERTQSTGIFHIILSKFLNIHVTCDLLEHSICTYWSSSHLYICVAYKTLCAFSCLGNLLRGSFNLCSHQYTFATITLFGPQQHEVTRKYIINNFKYITSPSILKSMVCRH